MDPNFKTDILILLPSSVIVLDLNYHGHPFLTDYERAFSSRKVRNLATVAISFLFGN